MALTARGHFASDRSFLRRLTLSSVSSLPSIWNGTWPSLLLLLLLPSLPTSFPAVLLAALLAVIAAAAAAAAADAAACDVPAEEV